MKITILTLFPSMFKGFLEESIVKRAVSKKLVEIELVNLRDFAINDYGTVDDKPYGGGVGMVIRVDVIYKAIEQVKTQNSKVKNEKIILTTAQGKTYKQEIAKQYSKLDHLIIIAGHYEGVDERVLDYIDEEVSIGDYVLTGGELPAAIITDSVVRLIPGVLKQDATSFESFQNTPFAQSNELHENETYLEHPQYTRPQEFNGKKVPDILITGNHEKISEWRREQSLKMTKEKRPDLLRKSKIPNPKS